MRAGVGPTGHPCAIRPGTEDVAWSAMQEVSPVRVEQHRVADGLVGIPVARSRWPRRMEGERRVFGGNLELSRVCRRLLTAARDEGCQDRTGALVGGERLIGERDVDGLSGDGQAVVLHLGVVPAV